jgi:hypothetical protein
MSKTGTRLVLLLCFALLTIGPVSNAASSQEKHDNFWRLNQTVQDILAGKNIEHARTSITKGARIVCGERIENLRGVVAGEIKACSLADTSYHDVGIVAETNPSEDAGYIILTTKRTNTPEVRIHTVVFMKDSTGEYRIHAWHAGE